MTTATAFKYANIDELNYGISIEELNAAERVCEYLKSANRYEGRRKTESEWSKIAGVEGESLYYAINVAKRHFHGVAYA